MRQKRAKTYKRVMALYTQTFNFRQPFQVLVSDDILLLPAAQQLDIVKLLGTCVQAEIKPMITQCCIESLYTLGPSIQNTTNLAKTFERRRCPTNKYRYVLAAQSTQLLEKMERIPGVPILHFNGRGVLVLSPPSAATIREKNKSEEERRMGERKGMEGIEEGSNVIGVGSAVGEKARGRGKGGNPNPLSMKKKKTAAVVDGKEGKKGESGGRKRRRAGEEDEGVDEDEGEGIDQEEGLQSGRADVAGGEGRKKKKRKRRGKGEVALAIQELNQTGGIGLGAGSGSDDGQSE